MSIQGQTWTRRELGLSGAAVTQLRMDTKSPGGCGPMQEPAEELRQETCKQDVCRSCKEVAVYFKLTKKPLQEVRWPDLVQGTFS